MISACEVVSAALFDLRAALAELVSTLAAAYWRGAPNSTPEPYVG